MPSLLKLFGRILLSARLVVKKGLADFRQCHGDERCDMLTNPAALRLLEPRSDFAGLLRRHYVRLQMYHWMD